MRVRVGDGVKHSERDWVNVTGRNSEPNFNNVDWEVVSPLSLNAESKPIVLVNGNRFTLDKHPNNNDVLQAGNIQLNDMIIGGWWNASEYWDKARFIGVDKDVKADWQRLSFTDEIPIL